MTRQSHFPFDGSKGPMMSTWVSSKQVTVGVKMPGGVTVCLGVMEPDSQCSSRSRLGSWLSYSVRSTIGILSLVYLTWEAFNEDKRQGKNAVHQALEYLSGISNFEAHITRNSKTPKGVMTAFLGMFSSASGT